MTDDKKQFDPFAPASGLLDDFDGTIKDAFFTMDPAFRGQLVLVLEMDTNDEDEPEWVNKYACGPDWASYDDGETAEHPKGPRTNFNGNTNIFRLFSAAISCGGEEELRRRSRELFGDEGHRHAAIWKGTKWHFDIVSENYDFTDKEGKAVKGTSNRSLPTKFLGVVDSPNAAASSTAATPSSAPTPSAPTPSTAPEPETTSGEDIPPELLAKVRLLAASNPYPEFVDAVMEIPGALQNSVLISQLGDEAFYASLKG